MTLQSVILQGEKEKLTAIGSVELSLSGYKNAEKDISSLKRTIIMGHDPISIWTDIQTRYAYNPILTTLIRRPIIGTAKADIKLANDGTMTEGSGELEKDPCSLFLDLLPLKELISKGAGLRTRGG